MPKHWNCFVAGCKSNYSSQIHGLKYYRIPKNYRKEYDAFFKTDCVKWETAYICSLHWSTERRNVDHMPDIRVPAVWNDENIIFKRKKRVLPYDRSAQRSKTSRSLKAKITRLKHDGVETKSRTDNLTSELQNLREEF